MTANTQRGRRSLKERFFGNPMVLKELRGRMRGARAFVVLTVYLSLMSGFVTLIYLLFAQSMSYTGATQGGEIGRALFWSVIGVEMFLVTFITPAFAAGTISGERERQTYDLLRTTMLPARSLVSGKLFATLSYVFLLLLAAIPMESIAFLFGGVGETEVVLSFVILLFTALLLGAVGVFFSAMTKRTLASSVLSYAYALFTVVAPPIFGLIVLPIFSSIIYNYNTTLPGTAEAILYYVLGFLIATNPLATLITTLGLLVDQQVIGTFQVTLQSGQQLWLISPWIPFLVLTLLFSVILVLLSVRRIEHMPGNGAEEERRGLFGRLFAAFDRARNGHDTAASEK